MSTSVTVRRETLVLPTYEPHRPDPNPMFLEKRVYQGSSGRVYPLPCTDRIADTARPGAWEAVVLENEFLLVVILPQLGGRIHRILDKTNGYDAVYHQHVIKPALVALAGPWCSGGIEFNWPQHHRPSTFMPTDTAIERHPDGAVTVWLGEHDPLARMKGMHGVRLYPGRSLVEVCVRAYNRTADTQTFLWWANVATRVHEAYQSFFPPDTTHVADHAKRATTTFPHATGRYYGVDYGERGRTGIPPHETPPQFIPPHALPAANSPLQAPSSKLPAPRTPPPYSPDDLSWYANIPVPTSYMAMGSSEDFCGGYDHRARAGLIHVASHHISPGKKQWTWGNHPFGYAWDRHLTDPDPATGEYAPYIELMAGVFTDNQPDFTFLQPGETKTWSQFWYPFRAIGPAQHANPDAAVSLQRRGRRLHLGVAVTARHRRAQITVASTDDRRRADHARPLARLTRDLAPDRPFTTEFALPAKTKGPLSIRITTSDGRELLAYTAKPAAKSSAPAPATEPAAPAAIASNDELYVIGLHLEQYRHATRQPEPYWHEALRRDPGDARCHLALGRRHLRRGEFADAEDHLRASIARLTSRNPNPADGEAYYQLGLCLRHRFLAQAGADDALLAAAYAALYKATWNHAWQAAGFHALAEIDAWRGDWTTALDHLDRSLRLNTDNLRARALKVVALRRLGRDREAAALLADTLRLDPLDWWARALDGQTLTCDNQVRLDLAHDHARAGLFADALALLADAQPADPDRPDGSLGTAPLLAYTRAWVTWLQAGRRATPAVRRLLGTAARTAPDYCFPARLEEIAILEFALRENPRDARAHFLLGNLFYDRRRHRDAIAHWESAARLAPRHAMVWRNLGIAYHNVLQAPNRARAAYDRAVSADPRSARTLYERDQLWKRLGVPPARRLAVLKRAPRLVAARDDLAIEYAALCNQAGRPRDAIAVLASRRFQPWEGGEGRVLAQHTRAHLALGRAALARGRAADAADWFRRALATPDNLGEARHLLANCSDIHLWLGRALAAAGDADGARRHWTLAAEFKGDFQEMSVRTFSEMTYFSALALRQLGRAGEATRLLRGLLAYARRLARTPATVDYFATSLPTMLLFNDDLDARQRTTALLLEAQALLGLDHWIAGRAKLRAVLRHDPAHDLAADLLRGTEKPN